MTNCIKEGDLKAGNYFNRLGIPQNYGLMTDNLM